MCFFKQLYPHSALNRVQTSSHLPSSHDDSSEPHSQATIDSPFKRPLTIGCSDLSLLLLQCLKTATANSQALIDLDQKLLQAHHAIQEGCSVLTQSDKLHELEGSSTDESGSFSCQERELQLSPTSDLLVSRLFGNSKYRYRLVLDCQFPQVLYKDRNFGLTVRLIDLASGQTESNGNVINLCLGVSDDEGEWVNQTKEGQPFLKGRNETELYHGSASFVKMAPRDVSRVYPNKMVNLVVYPKPSVLKYCGQSSLQQQIEVELIEPLVIHGVCIRAKRRD